MFKSYYKYNSQYNKLRGINFAALYVLCASVYPTSAVEAQDGVATEVSELNLSDVCDDKAQPGLNRQCRVAKIQEGSVLENVCQVVNTRKVWLFFKRDYRGSAVLYKGRYLITAGHNIHQTWSRIKRIKVRCGILDEDAETEFVDVTDDIQFEAVKAYGALKKKYKDDYGVIRLKNPINVSNPISISENDIKKNEKVIIAGFPGNPNESDSKKLYAGMGKIDQNPTDGIVGYNIATHTGNSGGPVLRKKSDGSWELVAIHVKGTGNGGPGGGRVINKDSREEIKNLIDLLDRRNR